MYVCWGLFNNLQDSTNVDLCQRICWCTCFVFVLYFGLGVNNICYLMSCADNYLDELQVVQAGDLSAFAIPESEGMGSKKKFFCKCCGKKFWNKTACMGHVNSQHLNVKPFECKNCHLSFSYKQSLKRHERLCFMRH